MDKKQLFNLMLNVLIDNSQPVRKKPKNKYLKRQLIYCSEIERSIPANKRFLRQAKASVPDVFHTHFKMSRSTFEQLEMMLKPYWQKSYTGRPGISLKNSLHITIWKLITACSYRELCSRFKIAKGTAHNTVERVTTLISRHQKKFIKWPSTQVEYNKIMKDFQSRYSCSDLVGCLGGTHIEIPAPSEDSESYRNEKGTHSIILQAICDSRSVFIDVYFGWPGSTHIESVWHNSPLRKELANENILLPEGSYILGDSVYPLSNYLIVPISDNGHQNEKHKTFNSRLSSTTECIEQALRMLRDKFRILKYVEVQKLQEAKHIVLCCIALHNHIINCEGVSGYQKDYPESIDLA